MTECENRATRALGAIISDPLSFFFWTLTGGVMARLQSSLVGLLNLEPHTPDSQTAIILLAEPLHIIFHGTLVLLKL